MIDNDRRTVRPSGTGADQKLEREERFRELFNSSYHHVLGYALRRAASRDDAADVVAETFLVAWRRLDDLPSEALTRPWLYGVARRVLANQRRSTGRRELLAARLREVPRLPVIDAPFLEGLSEVGAVLHRLAPGDRENPRSACLGRARLAGTGCRPWLFERRRTSSPLPGKATLRASQR